MTNRQRKQHKLVKRVAGKLAGAFLPLLALVLIIGTGTSPAFALPGAPHQFWGSVTINEAAAPAGLTVSAKIGVTTYATTTTDASGRYGYTSAFIVPGDDSATPAIEGGKLGDNVEFFVDTTSAGTTAFKPGGMTQRNLAITMALPSVTTNAASAVTANSATLNMAFDFKNYGSGSVQFAYRPSGGSWTHTSWVNKSGSGNYAETVSSLTSNTAYDFEARLKYDTTETNGGVLNFTTQQLTAPTVTTNAASAVTANSATLNMAYDFKDYGSGSVQFAYKPSGGSWTHTSWINKSGSGNYAETVSSLTSNTAYDFKARLKYDTTEIEGGVLNFTTGTVTTNQRLLGSDTTGISTMGGGYVLYSRFQAEESGTVSQIKVYSLVAGNAKVAIYADNPGEPGNKSTGNDASQVCNANQWNTLTIADTTVVKDTYYWIGVAINTSGAASYSAATGGTARYKPITYGTFTWPNSAGTGFANTGALMSLAGWGSTGAPEQPPAVPTRDCSALTFKWNASAGATNYHLQVNTSADFTGTNVFNGEVGNVLFREVTGLTGGTTYYYQIKAGNAGGWSAWSLTGSMRCGDVVPD